MKALRVERPVTLAAALETMRATRDSDSGKLERTPATISKAWLAGGQSLLGAMKLGMNEPDVLIDLQDLIELRGIQLSAPQAVLRLGAMETHASIAVSVHVRKFCPGLADLAQGIADQQVRNMGTIGGSLANNDPAACWPAGALALKAKILTTEREILADDFFQGIFATVLKDDELIVQIQFTQPDAFRYLKFEQAASRFALLGLAVARFGSEVRVAITGLGQGAQRWGEAEQALQKSFKLDALETLIFPVERALADLHASAEYRAHLVQVLCRRCVTAIIKDSQLKSVQSVETKSDYSASSFLGRAWTRLLTNIRT